MKQSIISNETRYKLLEENQFLLQHIKSGYPILAKLVNINDALKLTSYIHDELYKIVEHNNPLEGECEICPKIAGASFCSKLMRIKKKGSIDTET